MKNDHTDQCILKSGLNSQWHEKYPQACTCGGVGSWSSYSWADGPDGGPCPKCVEDGKCPRCGETLLFVIPSDNNDTDNPHYKHTKNCDYGICTNCGWNEIVVMLNVQLAVKLEFLEPYVGWECECWMGDEPEEVELPVWEGVPSDEEVADMQAEAEQKDSSLLYYHEVDGHVDRIDIDLIGPMTHRWIREGHLITVLED